MHLYTHSITEKTNQVRFLIDVKGYVVVQFLLWNNLFLNWDKIV